MLLLMMRQILRHWLSLTKLRTTPSTQLTSLKDGQNLTQEKVYRASKLSVSPGSFEDTANGNCSKVGTQTFNETSGSKTGLGFTLTTSCNPTLVTTEVAGAFFPTSVENVSAERIGIDFDYALQGYFTRKVGTVENYAVGSYLYHNFTQNTGAGSITIRLEVRVKTTPTSKGRKGFLLAKLLLLITQPVVLKIGQQGQ